MLVDVLLMLNEFVLNHLLQIGSFVSQLRQPIDHILHQMKAIQIILDSYVKSRRNRPLFFIASDVEVAIGPAIRQPVDEPGVSMKAKDDVFVFREERIVIRFA